MILETRLPPTAGPSVDLLKRIDLRRDLVEGDWKLDERGLHSSGTAFARVELPYDPPDEYLLTVVAEGESELKDLGAMLVVGGRQVMSVVDGFQGLTTGLQLVEGKLADVNGTSRWRASRLFEQGRPNTLVYIVRRDSVRVVRDGAVVIDWSGDPSTLSIYDNWKLRNAGHLSLQAYDTPFRVTRLELTPLEPVDSPAQTPTDLAGESVDLLKQIDIARDTVHGDWKMDKGILESPREQFSKLLLPPPPGKEYRLEAVVERVSGRFGLGLILPIGGTRVMLSIDGYNGHFSGLENIIGHDFPKDETTYQGRLLEDGKPATLVYTVRQDSIDVTMNGRQVVHWQGDPATLALPPDWQVPDPTRLALSEFDTTLRVHKLQVTPLGSQPQLADNNLTEAPSVDQRLLKVFEDEVDFVQALTNGDGQASLTTNDSYSGKASIVVTGAQRFGEAMLGLPVKIRKNPTGPAEYRYLRFAWKKQGGREICLQLHYPSNWFRYSAGPESGFAPATKIDPRIPTSYTLVTRDLVADFGEFDLDGFALSAVDGDWARFDHIYLARDLKDFESIEISPNRPPRRTLADLLSDNSTNSSRQPAPDDEALKKTRPEMKKKYASLLKAARSPEQKRRVAEQLAQKAGEAEGADAYVLWTQAIDLAEAAGDLDLAWQTVDRFAQAFAVDRLSLRNDSLAAVGKGAKSPEQAWVMTDAACRLMVSALAAGDAAAVKKAAAQAQGFARRMDDRAAQKEVTTRANDAAKLAGQGDAVAAARETLKKSPDDPEANFTVGHYELCAAGDWDAALAKLAQCGDAVWKKLAVDELVLTRRVVDPQRQTATGDGWWSLAEDEPWPGKHYLRARAARRYRLANRGPGNESGLRAAERLKTLLAADDGLPNWEAFRWQGFQAEAPDGEIAHLENRTGMETAVEFVEPIEVLLVAKTSGTEIRLGSHRWSWNWNFTVEPDRWHTLRFVITPISRTVFVDGVLAQTDASQTPRTLNAAPVSLYRNDDSVVEIRKFIVKPL